MNPIWLLRNVGRAMNICPTWEGRKNYLRILYGKKNMDCNPILFDYSNPIGSIELILRDSADNFIFGEIFGHKYYDHDFGFAPSTILDVGAHIGLATLFFSRQYPQAKIICIEPDAQNFAVLQENLRLNNVTAIALNAAIAPIDGTLTLEPSQRSYGHKIGDGPSVTGTPVTAISVQTIMKRYGLESIDLMKLDIEGYESVLLTANDGWLSRTRELMLEMHPPFSEADLTKVAARHGFGTPRDLSGFWLLSREPPRPPLNFSS